MEKMPKKLCLFHLLIVFLLRKICENPQRYCGKSMKILNIVAENL